MKKKNIVTYIVIFMASIVLFTTKRIEAAELSYRFDPNTHGYELYDDSLLLWDTKHETGHNPLKASISEYDRRTILAWLGMIMTAQALEKTLMVLYDSQTGIIISIRGPK